jgi:hypothetical protein
VVVRPAERGDLSSLLALYRELHRDDPVVHGDRRH